MKHARWKEVFKHKYKQIIFLIDALHPSQQLWSCLDIAFILWDLNFTPHPPGCILKFSGCIGEADKQNFYFILYFDILEGHLLRVFLQGVEIMGVFRVWPISPGIIFFSIVVGTRANAGAQPILAIDESPSPGLLPKIRML